MIITKLLTTSCPTACSCEKSGATVGTTTRRRPTMWQPLARVQYRRLRGWLSLDVGKNCSRIGRRGSPNKLDVAYCASFKNGPINYIDNYRSHKYWLVHHGWGHILRMFKMWCVFWGSVSYIAFVSQVRVELFSCFCEAQS